MEVAFDNTPIPHQIGALLILADSADGDNSQRQCFNSECASSTSFRVGVCDNTTGSGYTCVPCIDCPAGEYEDQTCNVSLAQQRTCQPVGAGYSSPSGENTRTPCDEGTFASEVSNSKCSICSSCGEGEHEDQPCTASSDRTCKAVDTDFCT